MTLWSDLRFALRLLRRKRTFAVLTIGIIAIGIGATTSIYSIVDGLLLRPLSFREPDQLFTIWQTFPSWLKEPVLRNAWDAISLSVPEYRDLRARQTSFQEVAIFTQPNALLSGSNGAEVVPVAQVSASLLNVLGRRPALGRGFEQNDETLGGARNALVSHEAWRDRFGSDAAVLGRRITLNDRDYTIVGVLPAGVSLGRASPAQFWTVIGQDSADLRRGNHNYQGLGRLRPGVSVAQAQAETQRLLHDADDPADQGVRLTQWQVDQTRDIRGPLFVLLGAVFLLLLIACVNVAVLLLGEAMLREQEIAARLALGAGRTRVLAQLTSESLLIAGLGGLGGTVLAYWGTKLLVALAPARLVSAQTVHVDLRVLSFALCATIVTGLAFGLAPALTLLRTDPGTVLRAAGRSTTGGRGRLQRGLVAVELALSLVLLVGAGLLARSLAHLTAVPSGFRADELLVVRTAMPRSFFTEPATYRAWMQAATERLRALPGVTGVTATNLVPFSGSTSSSSFEIVGQASAINSARREAQQRIVLPGYFQTAGVALRAGRTFTEADAAGSPLVAVISESAARRDWPNQAPVGARIRYQNEMWTVIGVVADSRFRKLSADVEPTIYTSFQQRTAFSQRASAALSLVVRAPDPGSLTTTVRSALQDLTRNVPITAIEQIADLKARSYAEDRFRTALISLFGSLAALLAAAGLYAVTARSVTHRRREVGIRVALGATRGRIVRMVVANALVGITMGGAAGLVLALVAARALQPYLFAVSPADPVTYAGAVALLGLVSALAAWWPARRAATVQPAQVLRE